MYVDGAIVIDEATGIVVCTEKSKKLTKEQLDPHGCSTRQVLYTQKRFQTVRGLNKITSLQGPSTLLQER